MHTPGERKFLAPRPSETIDDVDPRETPGGGPSQKIESIASMARTVAHDFNNLFCTILLYAELVQSRLPPDDPAHAWVEEIKKVGRRAAPLTGKLSDFCRVEVSRPEPQDLSSLVIDNGKMIRRLLGADINVEFKLAPALGPVMADPGDVAQVVLNLVLNVRDAIPRGGRLTVETRYVELTARELDRLGMRPGPYVLLSVGDTSCRMTDDARAQPDESFFTGKERDEASGLGLAKVCGLVRQFGGYMTVHRERGHDATCRVYFPQADAKAGTRESSSGGFSERVFSGAVTVLLAEDSADIRVLVRDILRTLGYAVLEASCGGEALRTVERHTGPIHLLVTDIAMPGGMSGIEMSKKLTMLYPGMKLLFLSGYPGDMNGSKGPMTEENFLAKPFSLENLANKIREVLARNASGGFV